MPPRSLPIGAARTVSVCAILGLVVQLGMHSIEKRVQARSAPAEPPARRGFRTGTLVARVLAPLPRPITESRNLHPLRPLELIDEDATILAQMDARRFSRSAGCLTAANRSQCRESGASGIYGGPCGERSRARPKRRGRMILASIAPPSRRRPRCAGLSRSVTRRSRPRSPSLERPPPRCRA
jgi:hypothetical protein